MKYPKGTLVRVYEGSKLIDKFYLGRGVNCMSGLRKMAYRLYPHLDHNNVLVTTGE